MKSLLKNIVLTASLLVLFLACTGGFEELNRNPKKASVISPDLVFPYVTWAASDVYHEPYELGHVLGVGLWSQYLASDMSSDRYQYNDGWTSGGLWNPYYWRVIKNVVEVEKVMNNSPQCIAEFQMMRIMRALAFSKLTDTYGDIPYFEAGKGIEKPSFDSQKDIYYDIFKELKDAVDILSSDLKGQVDITSSDYLYSGDVNKWIKFANSLRLRCAMRLSFIDPVKAQEEGESALAAGVMETVTDGATHRTDASDWSSLGYPLFVPVDWEEYVLSATLINTLEHLSTVVDPREVLYAGKTETYVKTGQGKEFLGAPNGLAYADWHGEKDLTYGDYSTFRGLMIYPSWNSQGITNNYGERISKRYPVMRYSEVCFLKAEAALRGWSGAGDAKDNYEKGFFASLLEARDGVDAKLYAIDKDNIYITTGSAAWDNSDSFEAKLEKIITQKWLAVFPLGHEGWAEFRRTGYPRLTPVVVNVDPALKAGEFIKKVRYPDDEKRNNPEIDFEKLNNGKGDGANVRVWWDTGRSK